MGSSPDCFYREGEDGMARVSSKKSAELEAFWRSHLEAWQRSPLNQREYCELHGLPLKRFGNWRATLGDDGSVPKGKLLWRRGGGLNHMTEHMINRETGPVSPGYIPSGRTTVPEPRRTFSEADKKRIVKEACRSGSSVSGIARRYGIAPRLLFKWKQDLSSSQQPGTAFLPVTVSDAPDPSATLPLISPEPTPAPVIVERSSPGIEVELVGGRRVRFAPDVDPETVRSLVTLLEGAVS